MVVNLLVMLLELAAAIAKIVQLILAHTRG
jgi:hypothetical protein